MQFLSKNKSIINYLLGCIVWVSIFFGACETSINKFQAPTENESGWIVIKSNACYFNFTDSIREEKKIILSIPEKREIEQINYLMQFTGLPQNFKIYRGNITTALATTYKNERIIIYNKDLFNSLNKMDESYWSTLFILAHEIGHHLACNISDTASISGAELQADKFAGTLLYNIGADSNQAVVALNSSLFSEDKNKMENRINAAKEGWHLGYKYRYQSVTPPSIDDELRIKEFNEETLLYNSYWNDQVFPEISMTDTATALNGFDKFRNLKGIILEITKNKPPRPDLAAKGFIQVSLLVRVTHAESSANQYFPENETFEFMVDFEPNSSVVNEKDFFKFFTEGRRLEFDVMFLMHYCDGCPYNITKAKAIYNSY